MVFDGLSDQTISHRFREAHRLFQKGSLTEKRNLWASLNPWEKNPWSFTPPRPVSARIAR